MQTNVKYNTSAAHGFGRESATTSTFRASIKVRMEGRHGADLWGNGHPEIEHLLLYMTTVQHTKCFPTFLVRRALSHLTQQRILPRRQSVPPFVSWAPS